jgi:hypothetical protein
MKWLPAKRGDILAIALALVLLAAAVFGLMFNDPQRKTNFGFGPEWDCKEQGHGDPVCIKRLPSPTVK